MEPNSTAFQHGHQAVVDRIETISLGITLVGLVNFVTLSFIPAPYGRYYDYFYQTTKQSFARRWAFTTTVPGRLGWILMESPNLALPLLVVLYLPVHNYLPVANITLLCTFLLHYLYR